MKVSIIVPIYGVERFIGECAVSLFSQTHQDLEYIFVDDCSPDHSIDVLHDVMGHYPDRCPQVHIIRNSSNCGSGKTRSIALAAATGEFVMYADSDDVMTTDAVERLVEAQIASGADIVDGAYRRLMPDGSLDEPVLPFHGSTADMLRLMLVQNTITHQVWGRLIRRKLHTDNNVDFIHGINMAEDYCIMTRLLFYATRHCIDDVVYHYRMNDSGTFAMWLNDKHVISYLAASHVVGNFLTTHDTDGTFSYPYELGILNTIHRAMGVTSMDTIRTQCPYHPKKTVFRICRLLLCHRLTRPLLRASYLIMKRLYVTNITKNLHGS